jgi:hypothetical protein
LCTPRTPRRDAEHGVVCVFSLLTAEVLFPALSALCSLFSLFTSVLRAIRYPGLIGRCLLVHVSAWRAMCSVLRYSRAMGNAPIGNLTAASLERERGIPMRSRAIRECSSSSVYGTPNPKSEKEKPDRYVKLSVERQRPVVVNRHTRPGRKESRQQRPTSVRKVRMRQIDSSRLQRAIQQHVGDTQHWCVSSASGEATSLVLLLGCCYAQHVPRVSLVGARHALG